MEKELFENYKKRLSNIFEFTVPYSGTIDEENDNQEQNMGGDMSEGMPPQDMPQDNGQQQMPMDNGGMQDMGGGDMNMQQPEGFNPQVEGDITQDDFNVGDNAQQEQPSSEDHVVDISEFTDSQKETEEEISKMDNKFGKIMKQLGSFEELLRQNDSKIEELKAEFEKRNPTQIEKLSMQTSKSYPFDITPEEYWKNKEQTSNYSTENDKNGKEQGQYVITQKDINGATNWNDIANSLDDDDFIYNQTLDGVLKY